MKFRCLPTKTRGIRTVGRARSSALKKGLVVEHRWNLKWNKLNKMQERKVITDEEYKQKAESLRREYGSSFLKAIDDYFAEKVSPVENPKWIYGSEAEINISPRTGEPDGKIYWMSPDEYLRLAGLDKRRIRLDSVEYHIGKFRSGEGVYVGHLKVENDAVINQEGRHRALAAKKIGIEKMPVLVYGKGFEHFTPSRTKPNFESTLGKTI